MRYRPQTAPLQILYHGAMRRLLAMAFMAMLLPAEALGQGIDHVLFFCEDEILGAEGECQALETAFGNELADFGVEVRQGSIGEKLAEGLHLPPAVVSVTRESGAIGSVWLTPGGDGIAVHVYTPDNLQTVSKIIASYGKEGELDYGDVAFRLRTFLGASLYSDIPDFDVEVPEPEPAPAAYEGMPYIMEDRPPPLPETATERRMWVRLTQGYVLLGYPSRSYWYHGLSFRLGVLALPALEIFVDMDITFPRTMEYSSETGALRLENRQYLVGVGAGYTFEIAGPFSATPLAGFHFGISYSQENWSDQRRHREVNTAVWAGIELKLTPARWLAFHASISFENLFNYEVFDWQTRGGTQETFSLSQFRMNVVAGACVSF